MQDTEQSAATDAAKAGQDASGGARAFDFWMGRWRIHNRRLRERLEGSTTWDEFEAACVARPLPGGLGNEDEYRTDYAGGFVAKSFRFFNPAARQWAIYWADSRRGVLDPPVIGSFAGDTGVFEGTDTLDGRPILVRFIWSRVTTPSPRWEQSFSADGGKTWETNWVMDMTRAESSAEAGAGTGGPAPANVAHLRDFGVVELRRYTIKDGARERFARCFESWFPEAHQQLGAIFFGHFLERGRAKGFTMLRGFKDDDARAIVCSAFYYGLLWKEHAATMNDMIVDHTDVLLLRPLSPGRGVAVLPAVDPVREVDGARGVVVAQVFAVKKNEVDAFAIRAEEAFAAYRAAGAREAGVLVTLDIPNSFPRLPFRTDGPFLVWLGILEDDQALEKRFEPLARQSAATLSVSGLLRGEAELVVLDPAARSRLRWVP